MKTAPQAHVRRRLLGAVAASVVAMLAFADARADAVKLSGAWIDDVAVQNVVDGQIVYLNNAGTEVNRPISSLQGLRLSTYPDLAVAQAAIDAGSDAAALESLGKVLTTARQPWLRHWTMRLMVGALDRLNKPAEAVDTTLTLLREKPQAGLIPDPLPIASLNTAPAAKRAELIKRLQQAIPSLDETGAAAVKKLVSAVAPPATETTEAPAPSGTRTGTSTPSSPPPSTGGRPTATPRGAEEASAVVLPHQFKGSTDEIVLLLQRGEFDAARAKVNEVLSKPTNELGMRLFQRGLAELNIADKSRSPDGYKDAGLSFMSVVVYFPNSSYVGPSLVEAAYIHHKLGDNETASKLLTKAALMIDDDQEPAYTKRIEAVRKMLAAPTETSAAEPNPPE
ncbi:MAG: hypothetical protein K8S99_07170 [Planctomycetes bacterium]|nr:hypothetical protein [Planctomycetota bacterium]